MYKEEFERAINAFKECISLKENNFLNTQIKEDIRKLIPVEKSIKIEYVDFSSLEVKIRLNLFDRNQKNIGHYILIENENKLMIDDLLVFY